MNDKRIIDEDTLDLVTDMLLIGLQAVGEIERQRNAWSLHKLGGENPPEDLRAIDPTGDAELFSRFADALRLTRRLPGAIEQAQH